MGNAGGYAGRMRLTPWEEERLLLFSRRRAGAPASRGRVCAERARGRRADLRRDARGGAGAARRTRTSRRPGARPSRPTRCMDGVRALVDEVRLEVLLGDGTRLIVLRRSARPRHAVGSARRPGRSVAAGDAPEREVHAGRERRRDRRDQHVAARGSASRRTTRSTGSTRGSSSTGPRRAGSASTCRGRLDERLGARRDADGAPRPLRRPGGDERGERVSRLSAEQLARVTARPPGDRIRLGDTDLWIRVGGGPPGRRRRAAVGLREDHPPADGPVGTRRRTVGARRRHRRRGRRRPGDRRRQGRHRHQGRPDRRASGGPATRRSATASTCRSARTRSRSWPTA